MFPIFYSGLVQLTKDPFKNLEAFILHGARHVEIFMDGPWWGKNTASLELLAKKFKTYPLTYSLHGPMFDLNLASFNAEIRQASFEKMKEAIDFATLLDAKHLIVSPGHLAVSTFDRTKAAKLFLQQLERLQAYAQEKKVLLLVENSGHDGKELFNEEEFIQLKDWLQQRFDQTIGLVLDTGHAHLNNWDIPKVIGAIQPLLFAIHLNDNKGSIDNHLAIGEGTIEWGPILKALHKLPHLPNLVLEYNTVMPYEKLEEGKAMLVEEF